MGLFEKVAWYNLIILGVGTIFYTFILHYTAGMLDFQLSFILFMSSAILMILCNFAWIIYFENANNPNIQSAGHGGGMTMRRRTDLHLIYWGAFGGILIGTWLLIRFEISNIVSDGINVLLVLSFSGLFFLYSVLFHMYKKRKGENAVADDEHTSAEILLLKGLPGHDERDLLIRKTSRMHSRMALITILIIAFIIAIFFARKNPGVFTLSFNTAYVPFLLAGAMFFTHIIIQISTIIQYRLGR